MSEQILHLNDVLNKNLTKAINHSFRPEPKVRIEGVTVPEAVRLKDKLKGS